MCLNRQYHCQNIRIVPELKYVTLEIRCDKKNQVLNVMLLLNCDYDYWLLTVWCFMGTQGG